MSPAGPLTRACGIETEYGVASAHLARVPDDSAPPLAAEAAVNEIFRHTPQRHRSAHHFLANGSRLYVDIGSHPEYAGAECRYLSDVLAQDRAGDAILADMLATANADLATREPAARIHLLKSNADAHGNTFGCHENYQIRRSPELPTAGFVGFLAARQILTGAGLLPFPGEVAHTERPTSALAPLLFSARAPFMTAPTSADPTRGRAFINTRDEPHADKTRWRRLHIIAGDAARCEATTAVKVLLADALLALIEAGGWDLVECELADPIAATRAWNLDPNSPAERTGGRSPITCPELLTLVCDRIAPTLPDDPLTARTFDLARRGIAALESGDYSSVQTELDWAIKATLARHVAASAPEGYADPRVLRTMLAFHDISDTTGLAAGLRRAGLMASWVSPEEVAAARTTPPTGTRARIRGAFVAACAAAGRSASVGWAHIRLDSPPRPQIDLPDPLSDDDAQAAALIAELTER
ncbi:proteasome accessory factor A [Bowdeniella nasicola]|uniref:Proteasome accessory factor A n=1 Tax=Bowdeniella nasicola TaxID=208480 RepID=A0A1H3XSY2_9ACTO|nr:proteasome accessory factor PafA2 family protein [Bowdeniella nasicola]SEA01628.1 proteasome accessory factor A [Bowdeniella nasicola]